MNNENLDSVRNVNSMPSPVRAANEILRTYWDGTLPVDPAAIATQMGILVYKDPGLEVSGEIGYEEQQVIIKFNATDVSKRQRFTVAHELGHFVFGDISSSGPGKRLRDPYANYFTGIIDPVEVKANKFAAALLMPATAVTYVTEVEGFKDLQGLADRFGVSTAAMSIRLQELEII